MQEDSVAPHSVISRIQGSPIVVSCQRMTSGYANANYRLETSNGVFLLRHRLHQDLSTVEYELNILDWLHRHHFPSPAALRFSDGERWSLDPDDGSYWVLIEWIHGEHPLPTHANAAVMAKGLAKFHQLPLPEQDWWKRPNPLNQSLEACRAGDPSSSLELFQFAAEEWHALEDQLDPSLPRGIIHGDLFPDNTLFHDNQLAAILDFEDACEEVLLVDVAMTIHGFCFINETWHPELADTFLQTYSEHRALTKAEADALPVYLRWCPLAIMGWHLQQWLRNPNKANEKRAAELAERIRTIRNADWP